MHFKKGATNLTPILHFLCIELLWRSEIKNNFLAFKEMKMFFIMGNVHLGKGTLFLDEANISFLR